MRTTITLDDDVAALIESERARTGESFKDAINRLLRRAGGPSRRSAPGPLPVHPGRAFVDITDTSGLEAELENERLRDRGLL